LSFLIDNMKRYLLVVLMLTGLAQARAQGFVPVNKNASPEAKNLLNFLYSIKGKYIISGEHNFNSQLNTFSDSVKAITSKYPGLWGSDFIYNWTTDMGQDVVNEAIKKWQQGYIVALMWHQGRPTDDPPYDWKKSIQGKLTDAQWAELTTPGTPLNTRWLAQIDKVAGYLKQLQDAHVPVLWRPYHEMNGVWFWWGDKKGKNGIQKLWKMMYDRYVNHFHLNNLLWVWGANGIRDIPFDEAYSYKDYYPGANYVDILGADVYHFDYEQKDYNELKTLANGKIMALTETGELPKPEVLSVQPEWAWFMVWTNFLWSDNPRDRVKQVYALSQTLNHDEVKAKLDSIKNGR
jgi:mannan endo-1,4-beta-mannosidase